MEATATDQEAGTLDRCGVSETQQVLNA